MEINIKGFIYHKSAEKFVDCFDRYGFNEKTNKFAISDGVSKSFFPNVWAELLIDFFLKTPGRINITDTDSYKSIQNEWVKQVGEIVNKPNQKYFVRNFFAQGRPAAATFVGLHFFKEDNDFKWEAVALGDSFLFFVPEHLNNIDEDFDKVIYLSSKKDFSFNNFPDFFDSKSVTHKGKIKQKKSDLKIGTFYLMTDALAEWFISQKQKAIQIISEWKTQSDFETSIINLRKSNLYNDDSTILIIQVGGVNSCEINYEDIQVTNFHELLNAETEEIKKTLTEHEIVQQKWAKKEKGKPENTITKQELNLPDSIIESKVNSIKENNILPENPADEERKLEPENNEPQNNRRSGFWEKLLYPFWIYWNTTESNFEEEVMPNDEKIVKKGKGEIGLNNSSLKNTESDKSTEEKLIESEIKSDTNDRKSKQITNKNTIDENNKANPKDLDDDISSITDKF
jgi:hypothetical protein